MKMYKIDKKGFTLVELLAVIVVLAIVMGLAVVGISSVLENTRKSAFAADAKTFLAGAHSLVQADEAATLLGGTAKYAPSCAGKAGSTDTKTINLADIPLDGGKIATDQKSPYGNKYQAASKITVTSNVESTTGKCTLTYKIYLTDGSWAIGTASNGVEESALAADKDVKLLTQ